MSFTHELRAVGSAAPVFVQALEPFPGLRIYPQPEELLTDSDRYEWRLGHHSGLALGKFEYLDDADQAALAISEVADWTRPAEDLQAEMDGSEVQAAMEPLPGIYLGGNKPTPAEAA